MAEVARTVELRILDGPNLYFPRPAVKLTLAVPGWLRASESTVARVAMGLGVTALEPGGRESDQRGRAVARIGAQLARRIAQRAGARHLAVRGRVGPEPDQIVVAFPWRRRGSAEALGRAVARAMSAALRRSPDRLVAELAERVAAVEPGLEPTVPDPEIPIVQVTGTNGKTTTTRLLAHIVMSAGKHVAFSSTDGVYRDGTHVRRGDYSGFGGAAMALAQAPDVAVLETARGGILLRGIGVRHNDVAVVMNVSADHLGLQGIRTVDQLAEVKATITRITRPGGWAVLNADDPRVLAMRRHATGRPWLFSLDPDHPALRETLAEGGRAMTVLDGWIASLERRRTHRLVRVVDVPVTMAGVSSIYTYNALAASAAALGIGIPIRTVARGLRTFVLDPERNPGRANVFELDGVILVMDYAHNEAGMKGLVEILQGIRPPGGDIHLAIGTAGDRTDDILQGFALQAAIGADHLSIAELVHYLRGRTREDTIAQLRAGARRALKEDVPVYPDELAALRAMLKAATPGDVVALTALAKRKEVFRSLKRRGARRLGPSDIKRLVRRAAPSVAREHASPS
jgi:cyanophycin synthetase